MYWTMLCAVSIKKHVATQSQAPAWLCAPYTSTKSPAHMLSRPGLPANIAPGSLSGTSTCKRDFPQNAGGCRTCTALARSATSHLAPVKPKYCISRRHNVVAFLTVMRSFCYQCHPHHSQKNYYRAPPPELLPFWPECGHDFDIRGSTTRIWSASDNWLQLECIQGCIAHCWARSQPFSTSADASSMKYENSLP